MKKEPRPPRLAPRGAVPPNDLVAESALLAAALERPNVIDDLAPRLRPGDFYSDAHALIWTALLELRAVGEHIDVVTLASHLASAGRLGAVGGPAKLAELLTEYPSVGAKGRDAYLSTVARLSERRRIIAEAHTIAAEGYGEVPEGWEAATAARLSSISASNDRRSAIAAAWRPIPLQWLQETPPPREFLLRYPTLDGAPCPPGTGDGFLPRGKAGMFSSAGGVGKTMAMIQLAVAVVTGHPWLGVYEADISARPTRVLLALAEEDELEARRRLFGVANALRLTSQERARVSEQLTILPLSGRPVGLLSQSMSGELEERPELLALRRLLRSDAGAHGWGLVVLDPLARWAGVDVESDNQAATRFVQLVETLCESPGSPTVLVCHHSSKTSRREGQADSRGVTGLTDGFRWAVTMRGAKGGNVLLEQTKSNLARGMSEPLELKRGRLGMLSAVTEEDERALVHAATERSEARAALHAAAEEARIVAMMRKIHDALSRCSHPVPSRVSIAALVAGKAATKQASVSRLSAEGAIARVPGGYEARPRATAQLTPPANAQSNCAVEEPNYPVEDPDGDLF